MSKHEKKTFSLLHYPVLYSSFQMEAMPISNAAELDSPEPRSTSLAV